MKLDIVVSGNAEKSGLEVSDEVFGKEFNEPLIHQVLTAYLARARAGTHATKTRAAVRGGGAKPWRQKGTGRARAGTSNSPIWRGGGMTFAKQPRDYSNKVNKKMYRAALRSIWSELIRQQRLVVVDAIELEQPKTKQLKVKLKDLEVDKALIITNELKENLALAARNVPHLAVCTAGEVSPYELVAYDKIVIFAEALKKIEEQLQ